MKVVWHIVRKDFLRLRWIVVLWLVMLIAGLGLSAIQSGLDEETYFPFWVAASVLVMGFLPLIAFGLVMGLLHDDPVAGGDAFWITRPISGRGLLCAKLTALLLLALVPMLTAIPFWLSHDYGWRQIVQAAGLTLQRNFLLVMLALPFAVISANGSKFVMNVMTGAAVLLFIVLLLSLGNSRTDKPEDSALLELKAWVIAALWLVTTGVVTLNQFLRRRTKQSVVVLALAVAVGCGVAKGWPWEIDRLLPAPDKSAATAIETGRDASVSSTGIAGEDKRMVVVAEVPLAAGASSFRRGRMLKIQHVLLDFAGELQVSFSEATPQLSSGFRDFLPGAPLRPGVSGGYFVINRVEGGAFAITPVYRGYGLNIATLHFSHATVSARPTLTWQGKPAANLPIWLKEAVLVEVMPADSAPARDLTGASSFSP